jgi:hypothetical protein
MFVLMTVSLSGCAPAATASPVAPTGTPSPLPPTFTPVPTATATLLPPTLSPQLTAIEKIRTDLELPNLPLSFVEKTGMINSPRGGLEVVIYQDSEGRKYSVDPETNQVVEIDARILLPPHGAASSQTFSKEVLEARALKYIEATTPDFDQLQSSLKYEAGGKVEVYFFSWYGEMLPGWMNRPFAQIGFHQNGLLFAYYNTLLLNK